MILEIEKENNLKQNKIVPEKESKVVRMVRKIDEKEQKERQKE